MGSRWAAELDGELAPESVGSRGAVRAHLLGSEKAEELGLERAQGWVQAEPATENSTVLMLASAMDVETGLQN